MRPRTGTTLVEQTVVVALIGILSALTFRAGASLLDALAVRAAARDVRDAFAEAREHAVARGVRTAVQVNPALAAVTVQTAVDTVSARNVAQVHGATLVSSRDSMAYSPSGLGYGAANMRIILTRHAAAETVTVSRLGRVK
jgi:Tfp pilus assembly protein PilE